MLSVRATVHSDRKSRLATCQQNTMSLLTH